MKRNGLIIILLLIFVLLTSCAQKNILDDYVEKSGVSIRVTDVFGDSKDTYFLIEATIPDEYSESSFEAGAIFGDAYPKYVTHLKYNTTN